MSQQEAVTIPKLSGMTVHTMHNLVHSTIIHIMIMEYTHATRKWLLVYNLSLEPNLLHLIRAHLVSTDECNSSLIKVHTKARINLIRR